MPTSEEIDAILPQTQCGLCGYKGCMPYAEALAEQNATINLCPPGGVKGLLKLGNLLDVNPNPYLAEMQQTEKPYSIAIIHENECIGCTKCIQACPVDAIVGTAKSMHSVISVECTGCELCIAPCPVDCIEMVKSEEQITEKKSAHFRKRYRAREKRLAKKSLNQEKMHTQKIQIEKKAFIEAALQRAKMKKTPHTEPRS